MDDEWKVTHTNPASYMNLKFAIELSCWIRLAWDNNPDEDNCKNDTTKPTAIGTSCASIRNAFVNVNVSKTQNKSRTIAVNMVRKYCDVINYTWMTQSGNLTPKTQNVIILILTSLLHRLDQQRLAGASRVSIQPCLTNRQNVHNLKNICRMN